MFQTGEIVVANNIVQLTNFLPSIDNLAPDVKDVQSIMIVPIYGHRAPMVKTGNGLQEGDVRETDDSKRKPIAIIQFVNKTDFKQIEQYDLVSFA